MLGTYNAIWSAGAINTGRNQHMRIITITMLTCLMTTLVMAKDKSAAAPSSQKETVKKQRVLAEAETLEKAAVNRETAAESQVKEALQATSLANALRTYDRGKNKDSNNIYGKMGSAEMKAGQMCLAAAANYEKAALNWSTISTSLNGIGEKESSRQAALLAKDDLEQARNLYLKAAQYYEKAVDAYKPDKGARSDLVVAASEKAASIREMAANK
jgi:tetratricopeptide (TPR) repeat protein